MPPGLFRGVQCQHLVLSHSLSAERHQSCRGSWCSAPTQWFDASLWFNILLECSIVDEAGYHAVQRVLPLPRRRTCGGVSSLRSQNLLPFGKKARGRLPATPERGQQQAVGGVASQFHEETRFLIVFQSYLKLPFVCLFGICHPEESCRGCRADSCRVVFRNRSEVAWCAFQRGW